MGQYALLNTCSVICRSAELGSELQQIQELLGMVDGLMSMHVGEGSDVTTAEEASTYSCTPLPGRKATAAAGQQP